MTEAAEYLERVRQLRKLAELEEDWAMKSRLLELAKQYEQMAARRYIEKASH